MLLLNLACGIAACSHYTMIDATDLTTIEVRSQYVQPLIEIILAKTKLRAATIGIQYSTDEAATTASEKGSEEGVIGTLYQEIELYKGESELDARENNKSYAEVSRF